MTFLLGGAAKNQAAATPAVSGLSIQTSAYGKCIPIIVGTGRVAPNLLWYDDFLATSHSNAAGSAGKGGVGGGGGGKGGGGSVTYTYSTAVAMALCEGPISSVPRAFIDKNVKTIAEAGFTVFTGTYPQAAWGYLTTNHPAQALGYNGIAYVAVPNYQLGNSPNLSNHNFEVKGFYSASVGAEVDADPSLFVPAFLTDPHWGVGFPAAAMGDLTNYQNYCLAANLLISAVIDSQSDAATILGDLAACTNSEFVWASNVLTLVPYGDEAITGNGKTYTPPAAPEYDIGDDDYIYSAGSDPVQITRPRTSDTPNSIKLEYVDRATNYASAIASAKDQASIDRFRLRQINGPSTKFFADATRANIAANLILQRNAQKNKYQWTTDQRFILLDAMDIVTLTDNFSGMSRKWVRITQIDENDDMTLTFYAEEYLGGTGAAPLFSYQNGTGYAANYNTPPGDANTPVIFEPPVQVATKNGLETWIATSGGENWGGCDVYISTDDDTYKLIGRMTGSCRQGVLTADIENGADPDTVNTLSVSLAMSAGELLSGTQNDADQGHTLIYVDGELMAYETATLTGANAYDLTYLRRGMYGSTSGSHASGAQFARLDQGIFVYPYDKSQIGQTISVKLLGFNIFGGAQQSLDDVTAFPHEILGPPLPPNISNFGAQQNGGAVVFKWDQVNDYALKGYDILYAPRGTSFGGGDIITESSMGIVTELGDAILTELDSVISGAVFLTEAARGTEMTNASVPPGDWTFYIAARDIADQLSPQYASFDLVVTNENTIIAEEEAEPDFLGVYTGFYLHWTGILIPKSVLASDQYGWEMFDTFVTDPVPQAVYTAPVIDLGFDSQVRVWKNLVPVLGPGESAIPVVSFMVDSWLSAASDPANYIPWTIGTLTARYIKGQIVYNVIPGAVAYISVFDVKVDGVEDTEAVNDFAVAAGGSVITFPKQYHEPPNVQATVSSGTGTSAVAVNVTETQAEIHVYNGISGVTGTANVTITGV